MRLVRAGVMALIVMAVIFCFGNLAIAGDSSGADTGNRTDVTTPEGQDTTATSGAVLDEVGHSKIAINYVWVFLGAILVFFMQAGFALVETGFCQKKNAVHVMMTNFMIFGIATVAFYFVGFAVMFGGIGALKTLGGAPILTREITVAGWGILGAKGFALSGPAYDVSIFMFFLFQVVFMDTTATIPTGAMAERWKFSAFVVYGLFMGAVLYPVFGNWVWGGGWLSQLGVKAGLGNGFVDFAGSSVVHAVGGLTGLMGILVLGPRFGKFDRDGHPRAIPGHNIPLAIVGTIILVFGWFGFNAASTLSGGDLRLAIVATNTLLASCFGAVAAMVFMWKKTGYPDPSMSANGCLAGLVAITAPCAFVSSWAAALIGAIAGIWVCVAVYMLERRFKIDDPVGAVAVHGMNGLWGVLALGIFADGTYGAGLNGVDHAVRGALYGGWSQLLAQLIGMAACVIFVCGLSYAFFKVQDRIMGIRLSPEIEMAGADEEMGVPAYTERTDLYEGAV
ncbi:MAG: ammonium transporter [Actinobacteria bacterium]|nr:ammonium transporter [Actinomycetota bacterium]MBU1943727.1 ammonium transporter [Actinomycetota bacterium]MBU2687061.1 ammonium transporter [Actinomycetota bacterium]